MMERTGRRGGGGGGGFEGCDWTSVLSRRLLALGYQGWVFLAKSIALCDNAMMQL